MRFIKTDFTRQGKPIRFTLLDEKISRLCTKYKIDLFYVFGSYASNKMNVLSDLDLAYYSLKKIDILSLLGDLQTLFQEEAIDLVDLRKAPSHLIHRIFRDGKCLFASSLRLKIDFETEKEGEYFDSAWMRQEYFTAMEGRIEYGTYGT